MTEMSYDGLEIRDGRTAPVEFLRIINEECNEKEKQKIMENLLKYCELDTLAQAMIVDKLKKIIS